ncbi:hypothetical protein [Methylocystis parvus]|uniref:hypothetical protein n=1 Tax=Methylocystis parvus TaxID=134 RepID=UPI003C76C78B
MIAKSALQAIAAVTLLLAAISPALCEVRFGDNVFVGGNDFSNQTFDRKHRAEAHLYDHQPANAGCRWRTNKDGGRTKFCRLRNLH